MESIQLPIYFCYRPCLYDVFENEMSLYWSTGTWRCLGVCRTGYSHHDEWLISWTDVFWETQFTTQKKKKKKKLARTTNRSDFRLIVSPRSIRLPCPRNLIWSLLITYRLNLLSGEGWWWRLRGCNREREMRVLVLLMNEVLSCLVGCSL